MEEGGEGEAKAGKEGLPSQGQCVFLPFSPFFFSPFPLFFHLVPLLTSFSLTGAKKELFTKAKYEELSQDKRKLHKAMDKKRRKIGQKEKKLMPNARPGAGR